MSLVQLELDEADKENFQQLQNEIGKAQAELATVTQKLRTRNAEGKHAQLTLAELLEMQDDARSYEQAREMRRARADRTPPYPPHARPTARAHARAPFLRVRTPSPLVCLPSPTADAALARDRWGRCSS